ncbi:MAG: U32 family peptidase [Anaerolineae bacterium]|jgi:putative protease
MVPNVELLAPARDLACGLAAIDSGADAVYIGAPRFGARANAGNSLDDLAALVEHAHTYWARVYVTVNTLLHDSELPQAVQLIYQLYDLGVDAIIIQDVGLLESDLPPIPLIASTQMHNHTPQRIAFLEAVGIRRVILARELDLDQIRAIRAQSGIELESFVHGALCVSYSGQCYMSYAIGGRSGNRGECAQPCRRRYSLVDAEGNVIVRDRHLLSLRDLNLSAHIGDLLDAGVTSFKIEGRLKDQPYITNVVSWYRRRLDHALAQRGWARSSSGQSSVEFEPDPAKTFNRGFTTYFLHGRGEPPGALQSPKMVGEQLGTITAVDGGAFLLRTSSAVNNGDGLCWFDANNELCGTAVNAVEDVGLEPGTLRITPGSMTGLHPGLHIHRNHDHEFLRQVERSQPVRHISVSLRLETTPHGFVLHAEDEDGNCASSTLTSERMPARKPGLVQATTHRQLAKTGDTSFVCTQVDLAWDQPYFLPTAQLNQLRREALDRLVAARADNRPRPQAEIIANRAPYPQRALSYRGNVLNQKAAAFYRRHGVEEIEPAAESGLDLAGRVVMRTRYCLQHQLGLCDGTAQAGRLRQPLYLVDSDGHRYPLRFDCAACEMEVIY